MLVKLLTYRQSKYYYHEFNPMINEKFFKVLFLMVAFSKKWLGDQLNDVLIKVNFSIIAYQRDL